VGLLVPLLGNTHYHRFTLTGQFSLSGFPLFSMFIN